MGLVMPAEKDGDLDSIKDTPEFKSILKRFEASKAPLINSSTAFILNEKGLITEEALQKALTYQQQQTAQGRQYLPGSVDSKM